MWSYSILRNTSTIREKSNLSEFDLARAHWNPASCQPDLMLASQSARTRAMVMTAQVIHAAIV
jgi:hypothetical protein